MLTAFWGCQQRGVNLKQSQAALSNADAVLDAYNAGRMLSKRGDYLHGEITILQRDPDAIYVHLVSSELTEQERIYILQFDSAAYELDGPITISDGSVLFLHDQFIVSDSASGHDMWFIHGESHMPDSLDFNEVDTTYEGYGVSVHSIEADMEWTSPDVFLPSCLCTGNLSAECDAGGYGSDGCSVTNGQGESCETSCGQNSFACCNFN